MKNYNNLTNYLKDKKGSQILTFQEIEAMVGEPISPVYYKGNTLKYKNSRYQMAANRAGYVLNEFSIAEQTMTFREMNFYEKLLAKSQEQKAKAQAEQKDNSDELGKELDSAINAFKSRWGSVGGQYVPFLNKYNEIEDVYYNAGMEAYRAAMKRAIKFDGLLNRIRKHLREESCEFLALQFDELFNMGKMDFDVFTKWAKETASVIRTIYHDAGVSDYTYGNAQKLTNVALKFVLSSNLVDYRNPVFKYCHFPVDGIIQQVIKKNFGIKPLETCWSKNDNWDEFVDYQQRVRKAVLDNGYYSPMVWEATHWNF